MSAPAAIQGSYADLRFVKGRKVCQIVIEIPIEAGDRFVSIFGAPNPAAEIPVAIARLDKIAAPQPVDKPRRSMSDLPLPQQAALYCQDPRFQRFIYERYDTYESSEEACASAVREICQVASRAEIGKSPPSAGRWRAILDQYAVWKTAA